MAKSEAPPGLMNNLVKWPYPLNTIGKQIGWQNSPIKQ